MNEKNLEAISPVDGRYFEKTEKLKNYFSEKALIFFRLKVEVEYFIALCEAPIPQLKNFNPTKFKDLRKIYQDFSIDDAVEIKNIEKYTNHDVKAVEYFIKQKFDKLGIPEYKEFIHFGLTSQDINNTAIPLSIKYFINEIYLVKIEELLNAIEVKCNDYKEITIISRTHGQPASPTKLGKEFKVFWTRINEQLSTLKEIPNSAKFSGAVGNFNAHKVAYPKIKWKNFAENFVENKLGLNYSYPTTQIEHYDSFAALSDNCRRINNILLDMCLDIWTYISYDYFNQKIVKNEVGSSAMPHKVNPIDFENAEGNLGIANSIFYFFSNKLTKSRLQRDLSDSTVLRNIGVPFSHTIISFESILKGLGKIYLNESKINDDIENNWIVVSEAIQTILRREGYPEPYEVMKMLTRNNEKIDKSKLHNFIDSLNIDNAIKDELKKISPYNYTGI
tara:strand:+ start:792 stop:2135 length:1344 start_codon:yes stop_codon:yes gene_type:complete